MKSPDLSHLDSHMVVRIAQISQTQDALASLAPCLDAHDRERATRFRFPEDRARFILGRGLIRTHLSQALQRPPATIDLAYTDRDRPYFPHDETIQFSISHTHDLVALALTRGARIGIDLEHIRPNADLPALAKRILSATDLRTFEALPPNEKPTAFFRVWTRKEAYLKARGEGIAEGLRDFSVSLGPEEISQVQDHREKSPAPPWRLHLLPVPPEYASSLACDDPHRPLDFSFVELRTGGFFQEKMATDIN
jgi:4'-phosphopantetheinyl transferase